ncbi:hypothetical protein ANN_01695 [Periplaneta americana]|uniref:Uncharacterized protein n=1 Tax=Periplaneta americana TaxID=6978 RepID=A0ABQ8TX98_PERAM|nr:hypothetical protein ANN_01695 [Periplaneta americana]
MDLREVGYDDRDWINLAQDRDRWRAYDRLYTTKVRDLHARIVEAIGTISPSMLERTWTEIKYRLDIHRATKGAHMEVYDFCYKLNPSYDILCL